MDPTRRDILTGGAAATAESLGMERMKKTAPTEVIESILTGSREGEIEILD
jgi:hypothetical protein